MNVNKLGFRYVVEQGVGPEDERGYLRVNTTTILGKDPITNYKWTDLRNATQFYTEEAARQSAEQSGLDGSKIVMKCRAFDEYLNTQYNRPWLWECKGSV